MDIKINLEKAINKNIENAKELFEEGNILEDNNKYARALYLYILSMEEIGKATMIFNFLLFEDTNNQEKYKHLLKKMRKHPEKIEEVKTMDFILALVSKNKNIKETLMNNIAKQNKYKTTELKNNCLYTFKTKGEFYKPSETISKEIVDNFKFYAKIRYTIGSQYLTIENLERMRIASEQIDKNELLKEKEEFINKFWS